MITLPSGTQVLWQMAEIEDSVSGWCELAEELSDVWAHWECVHPGHHQDVADAANLALERAKMAAVETQDFEALERLAA